MLAAFRVSLIIYVQEGRTPDQNNRIEQPRFARSIFEPNLENPCQVGGYNLKATCTFLFFVCCITSTSKRTSISVTCFEVNGEDDRIPKVIYQTILIEEPAIYWHPRLFHLFLIQASYCKS